MTFLCSTSMLVFSSLTSTWPSAKIGSLSRVKGLLGLVEGRIYRILPLKRLTGKDYGLLIFVEKPVNLHKSPNPLAGLSIKKPCWWWLIPTANILRGPVVFNPANQIIHPARYWAMFRNWSGQPGMPSRFFLGDVWRKFTGKVCLVAPPLYV